MHTTGKDTQDPRRSHFNEQKEGNETHMFEVGATPLYITGTHCDRTVTEG